MRSLWEVVPVASLAAVLGVSCIRAHGLRPDGSADGDDSESGRAPNLPDGSFEIQSDRPSGETDANGSSDSADAVDALDAQPDVQEATDGSSDMIGADAGDASSTIDGSRPPALPGLGLVTQLEADYGIVTSTSFVTRWRDKSGNGFDASESDPSFEPQLFDDANAGYPALIFAEAGDDLWLPTGYSDLDAGISLFFIASVQSTGVAVLFETSPNGPTLSLSSDTVQGVVDVDYHVGTGTTTGGDASGIDFRAFHLYEVIQQGSAGGEAAPFTVYLDGAALVTAAQAASSAELKTARLGPTIADAVMLMQAAVVYSRAVSNDERREIEQYLMSRWVTTQ